MKNTFSSHPLPPNEPGKQLNPVRLSSFIRKKKSLHPRKSQLMAGILPQLFGSCKDTARQSLQFCRSFIALMTLAAFLLKKGNDVRLIDVRQTLDSHQMNIVSFLTLTTDTFDWFTQLGCLKCACQFEDIKVYV